MGFDNECILNIQSLAGEYFCPVCRLLVYPNEALQSQCTHLYCKPCLTYVVNTTQACPYDGYLVTEADSKPLTETNKSLAETIGKTPVHCLYHRSGCTWQGTLSACVSHCSGCAFGNSPVVCNRCGVQIVHRQVQEHAQTCPGVSAQAQAGVAAATSVAADQTRSSAAASQAGAVAVVVPGKEADQQSGSSSQRAQAVAQAAAPTAEQWYHQQQQQQYQQYYQQYPGYDQYQQQYQQYYPYQQQQHVPVPASLAQPQANQPQNQAQQVRPVIAQQTYPPAQQVRPYTQYQQARPQLQVQQQIQPNKTPNGNTQSQTQNPTALSVAGHASYPQPNTEPQQYPLLSQSQLASTHQTPSPVQALTRFPQQPQQMHLLHSHASISSQQQQVLFPPPGQVRNVPPVQQTVQQPYFQQPYFQQPGPVPPLQQTFPRQSLQHHTLRPLGQPRLFPAPMHSVASSHGAQHSNLSNPVGRPSMPSHGVQSQLYSQYVGGLSRPGFPGTYQQPTNQDNILKMPNQVQLPSEQQSGAKIDSEPKPSVVANTGAEIQTENSGSDMKPVGSENKVRDEGTKEPKHMQGEVNGVPVMKEGNAESTINHSNVGESHEVVTDDKKDVLDKGSEKINGSTTTVEEKETANGSQQINPPFQAHEQHEEHGGNLVKDSIRGSDNGSQEASSASAQVHDGFTEPPPPPPPPTLAQGKYQPLPSHYGPTTLPQRLAPPFLEPPHQTPPQTHFGPHVPGHPSGTSLARCPTQYNSMHSGAIGPLPSGALPPPPAFDPRGGTIARPTHGPDMFPNQRPFFVDGRQLDPNFPGSLEHGKLVPNMKIMNSFDSALPMGPRDERLLLHAERFNSFPAGPSRHMPDRMDFLDDMKQFPRPFDRGPHGLRYDPGLKIELGGVSSRFLSPYDVGSSSYSGERLGIRHENPLGSMEPSRGHLDFFGQGPALGRRHMDSLASRSPGREHLGMSRRGFRGPDSGDINGRELRRFGEPFPGPFPESRFSMLPSLLRRGEFEGPGRMGVGDRLRNDITGHDGFSSHLHGRDRIGNVYDELHLREPVGFGTRPHHARVTDIGGPLMDQFRGGDRPHYPHLGEPGFRSNFLLHGLPNDSGIITGEASFDISRKRKPPTTGWCRICKVDCETIEGLELHSQTREHQKMAMDIVVTIKQNAKRKKIGSGDQSSPRDASKSRNSGSEDRGKKN